METPAAQANFYGHSGSGGRLLPGNRRGGFRDRRHLD